VTNAAKKTAFDRCNRKDRTMGSESETMKRGKKVKIATGKLSLYPLSVGDALRTASRLTLSSA
jgi:hypothetical protein